MEWENQIEQIGIEKIEITVETEANFPQVNKKQLARNRIFV